MSFRGTNLPTTNHISHAFRIHVEDCFSGFSIRNDIFEIYSINYSNSHEYLWENFINEITLNHVIAAIDSLSVHNADPSKIDKTT